MADNDHVMNATYLDKYALGKKAIINQLTTSKNVLFPGHNYLLTISTMTKDCLW